MLQIYLSRGAQEEDETIILKYSNSNFSGLNLTLNYLLFPRGFHFIFTRTTRLITYLHNRSITALFNFS